MTFDIFIISWSGQHDNAKTIARELDVFRGNMCVVYSDPDPDFEIDVACSAIRRPDELFWGDKFSACLGAFRSEIFLLIHADCRCSDWVQLVRKCVEAFRCNQNVGVWAPRVNGTPYDVELTRIRKLDGSSLSSVAQTDGLCFSLSAKIACRMKEASYVENVYGWGIGWMMVSAAYCQNSLVVVDESVIVNHTIHSGYPHQDAFLQMNNFMQQLTPQEHALHQLLQNHITLRAMRGSRLFKIGAGAARLWMSCRARLIGVIRPLR